MDKLDKMTNSDEIDRLFIEANNLDEAGDYKKAFILFEKMVALGNSSSLNNLAMMYEYGRGVAQDINKAIELYKEGWAKTSETSFALNLAHLYNNQKDFEQAKRWWQVAIDNGDVDGKLQLAKHLLTTPQADLQFIKQLLTAVVNAKIAFDICEADWEEADELLQELIEN